VNACYSQGITQYLGKMETYLFQILQVIQIFPFLTLLHLPATPGVTYTYFFFNSPIFKILQVILTDISFFNIPSSSDTLGDTDTYFLKLSFIFRYYR
jgi:hypothetical protein